MNKYGYRSVWYNSRKKCIHLWGWDENGKRIETIEPFKPYLYIESSTTGDATSIFNTNLRKITFPSQFERRQYVKDSSIRRLFYNHKAEQQFLLDNFLGQNRSRDFLEQPLKIYSMDIEVYSPHEFPTATEAKHPVNLITIHDSISNKYHTFGLKPYTSDNENVIYNYYKTEEELFEGFYEFWCNDYPDILTGWNCVSETEYVWLDNKIQKISKISKNNKLFMSDTINNYMNTGIKKECILTTEIGSEIKCSEDHIIPVFAKEKNSYKNSNTLIKAQLDLPLKDIERQLHNKDLYVKMYLRKNKNNALTYRQYILEQLNTQDSLNFYITDKNIRNTLKSHPEASTIIPIKDYWWGDKFWKKRRCWTYKHLKEYIPKDIILEFLNTVPELYLVRDKKHETKIILDEVISNDILQFLGFIFTDGTIDNNSLRVRYCNKYKNVVESYTSIYNKVTNSRLSLSVPQKDGCFYKDITTNNIIGSVSSFIYNTEFKKQINIELLSLLSYDQFCSFMSGLYDGDGFVDNKGLNLCHFDRPDTLKDLQQLLLWNNVFSTNHKNFTNLRIPAIYNNIHFITMCGSIMFHEKRKQKIIDIKPFKHKNTISKKIKYFIYDDYIITKIKKIDITNKSVNMFDLTTSTHYFTCNGIKVHNCDGFDIPYIINRSMNILGEDAPKKLSPVGSIFFKQTDIRKFGKEINRWVIHGINCVDYKEIYETFSREKRESYSLEYISQVELGEGKKQINATSLAKLSQNNWKEYVEYNIQDVYLLTKLEDKLRFLKTMRVISHEGFCNISDTLGKVMVVSGAISAQALERNLILSTFEHEDMGNYAGGFVKDIEPGLKEAVVTFDANSLYPNTIISLNISPETKIGKIKIDNEADTVSITLVNGKVHTLQKDVFYSFIQKENISVSKTGILFSQKRKGIVPEYVDGLYAKRVENQNESDAIIRSLVHCKEGSPKYIENKIRSEQLDLLQFTQKILLNSIYGVFANRHGPLYDIDCAGSITLTGQAVIKEASDIIDKYVTDKYGVTGSITHYNDTDSVDGNTLIRTNKGVIPLQDLYESYKDKVYTSKENHSIVIPNDLTCLSVDTKNIPIFVKVKALSKHNTHKKKYRIKLKNGKEIITSSDHVCIVMKNNKKIQKSAKDIKVGEKMICFI